MRPTGAFRICYHLDPTGPHTTDMHEARVTSSPTLTHARFVLWQGYFHKVQRTPPEILNPDITTRRTDNSNCISRWATLALWGSWDS